MKKSLLAKKLRLSRETLRRLEMTRMSEVAGGVTTTTSVHCTEGSYCYQCITVEASDCPQCPTNAC